PGGGQLPFSGPLPLLIAHGITGTADSEVDIERFARATVPGLQPDRTVKVRTAALGSVWDNATEIATEAQDTIHRTGAPAVNVTAHSKGGREPRLAMWPVPSLSATLGMLATPNGGSAAANKLCWIRHNVPFGGEFQAQFGKCDTDADALYE